jgi:hypothetical protein
MDKVWKMALLIHAVHRSGPIQCIQYVFHDTLIGSSSLQRSLVWTWVLIKQ